MGGFIFGMVRVLVNWWAYTWGSIFGRLIFGGLRYIGRQSNYTNKGSKPIQSNSELELLLYK